jgi:hypothetical protein
LKKIVHRRLRGTTIFKQDVICGVGKQSRNGGSWLLKGCMIMAHIDNADGDVQTGRIAFRPIAVG